MRRHLATVLTVLLAPAALAQAQPPQPDAPPMGDKSAPAAAAPTAKEPVVGPADAGMPADVHATPPPVASQAPPPAAGDAAPAETRSKSKARPSSTARKRPRA